LPPRFSNDNDGEKGAADQQHSVERSQLSAWTGSAKSTVNYISEGPGKQTLNCMRTLVQLSTGDVDYDDLGSTLDGSIFLASTYEGNPGNRAMWAGVFTDGKAAKPVPKGQAAGGGHDDRGRGGGSGIARLVEVIGQAGGGRVEAAKIAAKSAEACQRIAIMDGDERKGERRKKRLAKKSLREHVGDGADKITMPQYTEVVSNHLVALVGVYDLYSYDEDGIDEDNEDEDDDEDHSKRRFKLLPGKGAAFLADVKATFKTIF
jgi:hypothetical protein